jgi:predicted small metal-binding protein
VKQLSCTDMGGDCDFVARGQTADEVKQRMFAHARQDHPQMFAAMTPDMQRQMQQRMDGLLAAR